ncbi:phosphate/phosphite/phosphonate ABC transporter substrate-binding protein [Actibacterium sp. D379-3]
MIAALPMYDRPENADAHDRLWALIRDALRAEGVAAPDTLTRDMDIWDGWQHPDLVLGQACGLPIRARLHDRVTLIATADYGLPDTPPGHYHSLFVVRANAPDDLTAYTDKVLAYNEALSHSGWAAPPLAAGKLGFRFTRHRETGAHRHSAAEVAGGRADIAAIDAISWRGIVAHDPAARALKVIGRTAASPGQGFITARGTDPEPHLRALHAAFAALPAGDRTALGLRGLVRLPLSDYLAVPTPPGPGQPPGELPESWA